MVDINVYDMKGRFVKNILKNFQTSRHKSIQWNATDNQGQPVPAGVYIYALESGEFRQTKKMILLK